MRLPDESPKSGNSIVLATGKKNKLITKNKGTRIICFINQANTILRSGNSIDILQ